MALTTTKLPYMGARAVFWQHVFKNMLKCGYACAAKKSLDWRWQPVEKGGKKPCGAPTAESTAR